MMQVVGLVFDNTNRVLLIHKKRPMWQNGIFNGIGGTINENETPKEAMVRECREESGLNINTWKIHNFKTFENGNQLYYMKANVDFQTLNKAESLTDEEISIFDIDKLPIKLQADIREMIIKCVENNEMVEDDLTKEQELELDKIIFEERCKNDKCSVCGIISIDSANGFDTCNDCLNK